MYAERAQREGVTVEEIEQRISQNNAIRRIVDAQEIGHVVAFLCSPKAGSITGVAIDASGGSIPVVFP
jgi:enoyl-[acyl-carrier-protein] reductase (NADH)